MSLIKPFDDPESEREAMPAVPRAERGLILQFIADCLDERMEQCRQSRCASGFEFPSSPNPRTTSLLIMLTMFRHESFASGAIHAPRSCIMYMLPDLYAAKHFYVLNVACEARRGPRSETVRPHVFSMLAMVVLTPSQQSGFDVSRA